MSALRSFLFLVFLIQSLPGYGFSEPLSSFEESTLPLYEVQEQQKEVSYFDTTILHAEISLPPATGPKLKGEHLLGVQKPYVSWNYVDVVPLLYLHVSDNIALKLSSFSIAFPFHSFP
jgi:hypothetical protein